MIKRRVLLTGQVFGGGGSNPAQGASVWNPGAAPGDGYFTTWAEVYEDFQASTGSYVVYLDDAGGGAFSIPAAGTYDLDSRLSFERPAPATGQLTVSLADGAILQNLAGVRRNITLETNATATTALALSNGRAIEFDLGAVLDNQGTQPAIDIAVGETVNLNFSRRSGALATGAEIATIAGTLRMNVLDASANGFSADLFTGAGVLQYRTDGSFVEPSLASPPATVSYERTDVQNIAEGSVVWNPGAAPGNGYVTTWAEVMRAFEPVTGRFTVYLNDAGGGAFTVPVGTHEADSRLSLARPAPATGQLTVSLADGAVLRNLAGVYRNITVETNATATTALPLDNGRSIEFDLNARLDNQGTQPAIDVAAGDAVSLGFYRGSIATATTAAVANLGAGSTLTATFQSSSQASADWVSGAPTSALTYLADASYNDVALASAPGTVATTRSDTYANLGADPWTTAYDIDFSTFPNQNLAPDGVYALDGINWTSLNSANAALMRVQGGTGLQIDTSLAASDYFGARTSPMIFLPATSLIPGYDANLHRLRLSMHVVTQTQAYNTSYAGPKVGYECSATPLNQSAAVIRGRTGGVASATYAKHYPGVAVAGTHVPTAGRDVFIIECDDNWYNTLWGTYAAGWPTTALAPLYQALPGWPTVGFLPENRVYRASGAMNIFIANDTGGIGGAGVNFSSTITHFRVQWKVR